MTRNSIIIFFCLLSQVLAFVPSHGKVHDNKLSSMTTTTTMLFSNLNAVNDNEKDKEDKFDGFSMDVLLSEKKEANRGFPSIMGAGLITGFSTFVAQSMAGDDYEIAELPPPYIPALFGVVLLVGVGLLTSSLGNVMDEEASLGLQSGARAKKEIERSRSSYFKRK